MKFVCVLFPSVSVYVPDFIYKFDSLQSHFFMLQLITIVFTFSSLILSYSRNMFRPLSSCIHRQSFGGKMLASRLEPRVHSQ